MRSALIRGLAAVLLVAPAGLSAQEPPPPRGDRLTLADYLDFEQVSAPELSPDGRQIVFARRWVDKLNDRWESSLYIMNADGARPRALVDGSSPRWSPDGTRIGYLAQGEPRGTQIFVRWMDAEGAVTQVTRLTESPSDIVWAPDGKSIAFRMMVPNEGGWSVEGQVSKLRPRGATWMSSASTRRASRSGVGRP